MTTISTEELARQKAKADDDKRRADALIREQRKILNDQKQELNSMITTLQDKRAIVEADLRK